MHEIRRRPLRALAASTLGLALLVTAAAAVPAGAASAEDDREAVSAGGQVIDTARVDRAAAQLRDRTAESVRRLLATDPTARLDASDRLFFTDQRTASTSPGRVAPARAVAPLGKTFTLNSRPSSKRTIFLDFDGEKVCDTGWNNGGLLGPLLGNSLACGPYYEGFRGRTANGQMSNADLASIQDVWARVSEDFAPFDVNVTTQWPGNDAIDRSSGSDSRYGVHAVVSASTVARNKTCGGPGCAGVAYVGIFPDPEANDARILWAFPEEVGNDPRRLADVLAHEAGHTLGLLHDGGGGDGSYYGGHGIWGPIMGSGDRQLTQWSRGEYAGADQTQADLSVIADHGAGFRKDDHANKPKGATRLRRGRTATGVIATPTDVDVFRFTTTCRGAVKVRAQNAALGPNLDISLGVLRPGTRKVRTIDPRSAASGKASGLDAAWKGKGARGTWWVSIDGVGARSPATDGYSDYGSLGGYSLKVTGRCVSR